MVGIPFDQKANAKIFRESKALGYKFIYEKGQRNLESEKIYKTINAARKAAMPYAYPPASILKVYKTKRGEIIGRYVGAVYVANYGFRSEVREWRSIDDLESIAKYVLNPDGSIGKMIMKFKKR